MKYCVYPTLRTKCIKCKKCIKDANEEGLGFEYEDPWNDPDWID